MVVFLHADAVSHLYGLFLCKNCSAGIALFLGAVPVLVVARKVKVGLVRLHLGLAQAEDVGVLGLKKIKKAFARTGAQAVYIPGNQFHQNPPCSRMMDKSGES